MTNLERTIAVLLAHREARQWTDEAAARDVLAVLRVDPAGDVDAVVASVVVADPATSGVFVAVPDERRMEPVDAVPLFERRFQLPVDALFARAVTQTEQSAPVEPTPVVEHAADPVPHAALDAELAAMAAYDAEPEAEPTTEPPAVV